MPSGTQGESIFDYLHISSLKAHRTHMSFSAGPKGPAILLNAEAQMVGSPLWSRGSYLNPLVF